jgi:hypothetical protein
MRGLARVVMKRKMVSDISILGLDIHTLTLLTVWFWDKTLPPSSSDIYDDVKPAHLNTSERRQGRREFEWLS